MAEASKSNANDTGTAAPTGRSRKRRGSRLANLAVTAGLLAATAAPLSSEAGQIHIGALNKASRLGAAITESQKASRIPGETRSVGNQEAAVSSRIGGFAAARAPQLSNPHRQALAAPKLDQRGGLAAKVPINPYRISRGWNRDTFFSTFFVGIEFNDGIQLAIANDIDGIVVAAQSSGNAVYCVSQPGSVLEVLVAQPNGVVVGRYVYAPQGPENVVIARAVVGTGGCVASTFALGLQYGGPHFQVMANIVL